jgi:hypothetical protein
MSNGSKGFASGNVWLANFHPPRSNLWFLWLAHFDPTRFKPPCATAAQTPPKHQATLEKDRFEFCAGQKFKKQWDHGMRTSYEVVGGKT